MRTELSWAELRRGAADVRIILGLRAANLTAQNRRRARGLGVMFALITGSVVLVPALVSRADGGEHRNEVIALLPTLYLGFVVFALLASLSSGGGRELIPREPAAVYPISTATEHFGALVLAPLNIAWVLQAWMLLGATAYALPTSRLPLALIPVLVWIVAATAIGQALAWSVEAVRRGPHGTALSWAGGLSVAGALSGLIMTDRLVPLLDSSPTVSIYVTAANAAVGWTWVRGVVLLLVLAVAMILLGLVPARWALRQPVREEARLETGIRRPQRPAFTAFGMLVRLDRDSIWRSVPIRRGLLVLAAMPAGAAVAGDFTWDLIVVLPGFVASGAALLFGVNAWSLDGRGALWRESLPVPPLWGFLAKVLVLAELSLVSALPTIGLAALRAGTPTPAQAAAVLGVTVAVTAHVVAAAMDWSVGRPYTVDMRSARATPAPPVVMVGYSARLALWTTVVGLFFTATALASTIWPALLLMIGLIGWSSLRILRTARRWLQPVDRARVIAVVSA